MKFGVSLAGKLSPLAESHPVKVNEMGRSGDTAMGRIIKIMRHGDAVKKNINDFGMVLERFGLHQI
ncbi:MAG: hypothetical protein ACXWL9_08715 [Syntrophales bacterium]